MDVSLQPTAYADEGMYFLLLISEACLCAWYSINIRLRIKTFGLFSCFSLWQVLFYSYLKVYIALDIVALDQQTSKPKICCYWFPGEDPKSSTPPSQLFLLGQPQGGRLGGRPGRAQWMSAEIISATWHFKLQSRGYADSLQMSGDRNLCWLVIWW